ncbi:MAG: hypothetical protein VYA54_10440 [Bdellovibrionota bacterium]|nr:hypothetical protein [Bdellovibrionota bacterium]
MRIINFLILTALMILSISAIADERKGYINLNSFLDPRADLHNDIAYIQLAPQYEENPDINRAVTIEYFFGEYTGDDESLEKLEQIRQIIADDKAHNPFAKNTVIAVGPDKNELLDNPDLERIMKKLELGRRKVHIQDLPEETALTASLDKSGKRYPSSLVSGRTFWTFVRFASTTAGTFGALYFMQGVSAPVASAVALVPGLLSGAIIYHSNRFGEILTNGKWSNYLMESDSFFAKNLRKSFKITAGGLQKFMSKMKRGVSDKFPRLVEKYPNIFNDTAPVKPGPQALKNLMTKLQQAEEYFKWYITEVAFTGIGIKLPQALAGISTFGTVLGTAGEVLFSSLKGMAAQGPGDIAIQVRKYQKVAELKENINAGKIKVDNSEALLEEIEKVLAKTGKYEHYTIHDGSHKLLVKIENWSRSRATLLSFFAITGVGMDIAGIPLATPLLISVGVGGFGYYGAVQGWFKPREILEKAKDYFDRLRRGEVKFSLQFLKTRFCAAPFRMKTV